MVDRETIDHVARAQILRSKISLNGRGFNQEETTQTVSHYTLVMTARRSDEKERMVDALALRADERRDKLR